MEDALLDALCSRFSLDAVGRSALSRALEGRPETLAELHAELLALRTELGAADPGGVRAAVGRAAVLRGDESLEDFTRAAQ